MDYAHTASRTNGLCTLSLEMRWVMHKQPGYQMDYIHGLEIQWIIQKQSGDPIEYAHTPWRTDGLSTHSLEIRWTKHTQTGDQMD
jgi:hypothetical protein